MFEVGDEVEVVSDRGGYTHTQKGSWGIVVSPTTKTNNPLTKVCWHYLSVPCPSEKYPVWEVLTTILEKRNEDASNIPQTQYNNRAILHKIKILNSQFEQRQKEKLCA